MKKVIVSMQSIVKLIDNLFNGKFKHLSRFSMIGVANTLIDFLVFTISNSVFGINYIASQALGYSCGIANSFVFNKNWTFQDSNSKKKKFHELTQFIVINLITLIITMISIRFIVNSFNMNVYIAKIIITILAQAINFLAYKLWIFN
jgi:putative flippase GtrA